MRLTTSSSRRRCSSRKRPDPASSTCSCWPSRPAAATTSGALIAAGEAVAPNTGQTEERAWEWASHQLAHELARLRKLGAGADGETGEPHPLLAIREVLARQPCDEIVLATSPHRVTRLLAMDLQHRLHRSFGLPVTVLGHRPGR